MVRKFYIQIETSRDAYSPDEVSSMTVAELISVLEQYNDDTEVILSFDNGYTFGGISEYDISDEVYEEEDYEEEEEEEDEEL